MLPRPVARRMTEQLSHVLKKGRVGVEQAKQHLLDAERHG
jgi:hypothetical protein